MASTLAGLNSDTSSSSSNDDEDFENLGVKASAGGNKSISNVKKFLLRKQSNTSSLISVVEDVELETRNSQQQQQMPTSNDVRELTQQLENLILSRPQPKVVDDKDDHFGIVEGGIKKKHYLRFFIIGLIVNQILFLIACIIQLCIPTIEFEISFTVVGIVFFAFEFVWVFDQLIVHDADIIDFSVKSFVGAGLYILTIIGYLILLFFLATDLSWFTLIFVNVVISVILFGSLTIVHFFRKKFKTLTDFGKKLLVSGSLGTLLLLNLGPTSMPVSIAICWGGIITFVVILIETISTFVEVYQGIRGPYDNFKLITVLSTAIRLILGQFVTIIVVFQSFKQHGLPLIWVFMPPSWFKWI